MRLYSWNILLLICFMGLLCIVIFHLFLFGWINLPLEGHRPIDNGQEILHSFASSEALYDERSGSIEYEGQKETTGLVDRTCNMETCFDYTKCVNEFRIYVYPDTGGEVSVTYAKLLDALRSSTYLTSDPTKACIFVPSVDTLDRDPLSPNFKRDAASQLARLAYWGSHGRNHLIFNLYAGTWPYYLEEQLGFRVDQAILAKASFSTTNLRRGFDISLPLIHKQHAASASQPKLLKNYLNQVQKRILLTFKGKRYLSGFGSASRNALYHLHNGKDVLLLTTCRHGNDWTRYADERCASDMALYDKYDYKDLLHNSTFCLVPRGRRLGSYRFLETLSAGCIPVMLSNDWDLPFSEVIDWRSAVVWADERLLFQVTDIVRSISDDQVLALRQQSKFLWDSYFASVSQIVNTVLEIIKDRIAIRGRNWFLWNSAPGALAIQAGYSTAPCDFPLDTVACRGHYDVGFTAVILVQDGHYTFTRLLSLLSALAKSKYTKKVILIWQSTDAVPSMKILKRNLEALPLQIISHLPRLGSSRYLPHDDIPTPAVLSLEADVAITSSHADFGYSVWREFPTRMVGYTTRNHVWDEVGHVWKYSSEPGPRYSMVLGHAAFYHKYYHWLYWRLPHQRAREVVDVFNTCEDLLMNVLVSHVTHRSPLALLDNQPLTAFQGPSPTVPSLKYKHTCLQAFARHMGYMPLVRSVARVDPVLFKDDVAIWRKKYAELETGSL